MATLRRWWWLPAALAVVGAVLGGLAGVAAPKSAEALVRVQSSNPDPQAVADSVQGAMLAASSRDVYDAAGKKLGVSGDEVRKNVEVGAVAKTAFLSVKATDRDAAEAARYANAVADAAVEASSKQVDEQLAELTRTTGVIIDRQKLTNPDAEKQRVAGLGTSLADQQGSLLMASQRLSLLQSAQAADAEGPSKALLTFMGLIGGALAGLALALILGGRRGRIGSIEEMRRVYPNLELVRRNELPGLVALEGADAERVVLTGVRAPAGAIQGLVEPVTSALHSVGRDVVVTDDLGSLSREVDPRHPNAVTVLQTPLSAALLRRLARDTRAMTVVLVRSGKTRFEWLDEHIDQFGDRLCVVVDG